MHTSITPCHPTYKPEDEALCCDFLFLLTEPFPPVLAFCWPPNLFSQEKKEKHKTKKGAMISTRYIIVHLISEPVKPCIHPHTFDHSLCLCIITPPLYLSPYLFLIISLRASSISSAIFILCCYTINSHRTPTYYQVSPRSSVCTHKNIRSVIVM